MGALMTGAAGVAGLTVSAFAPVSSAGSASASLSVGASCFATTATGVAVAMKVARSITYFFVSVVMPVTTKERSTPYFFLRYWSAFTWSVISPGITSSPQGRKVGTPFSTMASAYWTVVAVTVRVIFSKAHTLPFAVKNFSFFNSLYKNGLSGLIWPLLPAEHPRCFAAQELPAAIASWQKTLSRMYLCFFEKAQWLAPARIVGWLYAKGWMKPVLPKGGRYGKQGVSSACSGEESGVRTHGAFYTQRFSGPPPSSTRPPLRMCPCAWPVIWSFQLWCSQCRK